MLNMTLLQLCKQYAAGQVRFYDYREIRRRILWMVTAESEEKTMPVQQGTGAEGADDEATTPYEKNSF